MLTVLLACTPPSHDAPRVPAGSEPLHSVDGPRVVWPSDRAPYAREVRWTLDRPVTVHVEATDGRHALAFDAPRAAEHALALPGLYADAAWTVDLVATDDDGEVLEPPALSFTTDPLPTVFPEIASEHAPDAGPALTLTSLVSVDSASYVVAFDAEGEIAWLLDNAGVQSFEAVPLPRGPGEDGGLLVLQGTDLVSLDWLGRTRLRLASWSPYTVPGGTPVPGTWAFNHELHPTPAGTWLTVSRQVVNLADFPVSYDDPALRADATVLSDSVVEIDPASATVVRSWDAWQHIDRERIAFGSLDIEPIGIDWLHMNAISGDGDEWLVSMRHQDAVVLVDASSGEVEFILGTHDNWGPEFADRLLEPVGDLTWPWHQHAAKWLPGDRVLLFDNGNFATSPWTGVPKLPNSDVRSRVACFRVDRAARTVEQEWSFEPDPPVFSGAMGDADLLPDGHVLASFAYVLFEGGVSNEDRGRRGPFARIVEFDPADGRVVRSWEAWSGLDGAPSGWHTFRAERFSAADAGFPE